MLFAVPRPRGSRLRPGLGGPGLTDGPRADTVYETGPTARGTIPRTRPDEQGTAAHEATANRRQMRKETGSQWT
jgi:hypothetical protein